MIGWVTVKDIALKFSSKFRQLRILINLLVFYSYYVHFSFAPKLILVAYVQTICDGTPNRAKTIALLALSLCTYVYFKQ